MDNPDPVLRELLTGLVRSLVDHPDQVAVEVNLSGKTVEYVVRVAAVDVGQVIGRKGNTAKALRMLFYSIGMKDDQRITIDIPYPRAAAEKL